MAEKRPSNRTPETFPAVWGRGGRWADRALISEGMDLNFKLRSVCTPDTWIVGLETDRIE